MKNIIKALQFAVLKHKDQKYADYPYVKHLLDTLGVVREYKKVDNEELFISAILHDVIEDTDATLDEVELLFGSEVKDIIWAVTGEGINRKERNASILKKIYSDGKLFNYALMIKLADRIANVRSCKTTNERLFQMYKKEYPAFRNHFNVEYMNYGYTIRVMFEELDGILK